MSFTRLKKTSSTSLKKTSFGVSSGDQLGTRDASTGFQKTSCVYCGHLFYRLREHKRNGSLVGNHFRSCECELSIENVKILTTTYKSVYHLMTLEALFIDAIKPGLNITTSSNILAFIRIYTLQKPS